MTRPGGAALSRAVLLVGLLGLPEALRAQGADGEFSRRRSPHFELFQDVDIDQRVGREGSRQFEREVVDVLENAYDEVDRRLGLAPRGRTRVVVYDPEVFQAEFGSLVPFSVAGFYHGMIRIRGSTRVDERLEVVLVHEYVHAAVDAEAPGVRLPGWVNEGTAQWVAGEVVREFRVQEATRARLAQEDEAGRLIPLEALAPPSFAHLGSEAGLAYLQSQALVDYLVAERGEVTFRRFLRSLLRGHPLPRALKSTYATDLEGLEESFSAFLLDPP